MTFKQNTGFLAAVLLVMVLLFGSTLAVAKGRGGDPTVCQGEHGRAFGLCNAYCEAMDCDWDLNAPEDDCADVKSNYQRLTGEEELPCEQMSQACVTGDMGAVPSSPFDVGDGNNYGGRELGFTVPAQCECDGNDCDPCPIVVGYHGFNGTGDHWQSRLVPKGAAVGFISLYPTGDLTDTNYAFSPAHNWAVPSCQDPVDGCLLLDGIPCDWCGSNTEDEAISTQREIDFSRAIIKWTMDNYCVDPGQIFGTGYSNGGLMSHLLARHPDTSGLFKALLPMDGVDQAGMSDHLRWIHAPQEGDSPWILHVNEIYDRFEPYDGQDYTDYAGILGGSWNPVWIYPPVLQIFAEYAAENDGYSDCGFGPGDVGDRDGALDVGGVVPEGYRRMEGLEGAGQEKFNCFTKDAEGKTCSKLAICLWDTEERGDDVGDSHWPWAAADWSGGTDPTTGGTEAMDIMWRWFQWSVDN
jgi:dienelactone hydrolase